ncbi:hypothetical protein B0H63DRAFT_472957 [Podospora didyma]|uniref:C2H2-type domain-containing protein n=1 Tax=Podospora didyma TaxID=330526 RepID=A0AAE0TZU9_9PEZI|nr:hypothetical protein B0H63DRAFT_472957 [Podospora didyma]
MSAIIIVAETLGQWSAVFWTCLSLLLVPGRQAKKGAEWRKLTARQLERACQCCTNESAELRPHNSKHNGSSDEVKR